MEQLQHQQIRRRREDDDLVPEEKNTSVPSSSHDDSQSPPPRSLNAPAAQLKEAGSLGAGPVAPPAVQVQQQLQGKGQSLSDDVRSGMENAMGTDLSGVKVHTGAQGNEIAQQHNARAVTVGQDIAFASGEFQPGTMTGDALLAHELHHTQQQKGATAAQAKHEAANGNENDFEKDADEAALSATGKIHAQSEEWESGMEGKSKSAKKTGLRLQRCGGGNGSKTSKDSLSTVSKTSIDTAATKIANLVITDPRKDPDIKSLADILKIFPGMPGADAQYLGSWTLLQTDEFREVSKKDYHLSYGGAIEATRLMLQDMISGKKITAKDYKSYAQRAVKIPSYEEKLYSDDAAKKDALIQTNNSAIWSVVSTIKKDFDKEKTLGGLESVVKKKSSALWENAKGQVDDRPIYWARIKMEKALREHALLSGNPELVEKYYDIVEKYSRGRDDIKFKAASKDKKIKRVLISGFDPYQGGTSNASGIVAHMLDGKIVGSGNDQAEIEAVTFPTKYSEFDRGVVENVFQKYIQDKSLGISMVVTISLDPSVDRLMLERIAANTRAGWFDNENVGFSNISMNFDRMSNSNWNPDVVKQEVDLFNNRIRYSYYQFKTDPCPLAPTTYNNPQSVIDYFNNEYRNWTSRNLEHLSQVYSGGFGKMPMPNTPSFIPTTFKLPEMVRDTGMPPYTHIRQSYKYRDSAYTYSSGSPADFGHSDYKSNPTLFRSLPPRTGVSAISGPAGDYLSNEIYYRVSYLRDSYNAALPSIHIHIPPAKEYTADPAHDKSLPINTILSEVQKSIALAVRIHK